MRNIEELSEVIDSINSKIDRVNVEKNKIVDIKSCFSRMDVYEASLMENYNLFYNLIDSAISKIKSLNKLITDELLVDYSSIYTKLSSACADIVERAAKNVGKMTSVSNSGVSTNGITKLGDSSVNIPRLGDVDSVLPRLGNETGEISKLGD